MSTTKLSAAAGALEAEQSRALSRTRADAYTAAREKEEEARNAEYARKDAERKQRAERLLQPMRAWLDQITALCADISHESKYEGELELTIGEHAYCLHTGYQAYGLGLYKKSYFTDDFYKKRNTDAAPLTAEAMKSDILYTIGYCLPRKAAMIDAGLAPAVPSVPAKKGLLSFNRKAPPAPARKTATMGAQALFNDDVKAENACIRARAFEAALQPLRDILPPLMGKLQGPGADGHVEWRLPEYPLLSEGQGLTLAAPPEGGQVYVEHFYERDILSRTKPIALPASVPGALRSYADIVSVMAYLLGKEKPSQAAEIDAAAQACIAKLQDTSLPAVPSTRAIHDEAHRNVTQRHAPKLPRKMEV
jgi:hypothetical protein